MGGGNIGWFRGTRMVANIPSEPVAKLPGQRVATIPIKAVSICAVF
jgi:hypothetical protein